MHQYRLKVECAGVPVPLHLHWSGEDRLCHRTGPTGQEMVQVKTDGLTDTAMDFTLLYCTLVYVTFFSLLFTVLHCNSLYFTLLLNSSSLYFTVIH